MAPARSTLRAGSGGDRHEDRQDARRIGVCGHLWRHVCLCAVYLWRHVLPRVFFRGPWCEYASKMLRSAAILVLMGTIGFSAGQPGGHRAGADLRVPGGPLVPARSHVVHPGIDRPGRRLLRRHGLERPLRASQDQDRDRRSAAAQALDQQYFGEGITEWQGSLLQLTWQSQVGFVYDAKTFERTRTFAYKGEGWGLTHDGTRLILSDGSPRLRFLDPATFKETGGVIVRDARGPVASLNELEFVKGEIFANVWQSDRIARIDPKSGRVTGWIDLTGLMSAAERGTTDAVLNGIAYDAAADRLFVTGKLWPRIFEIKLVTR